MLPPTCSWESVVDVIDDGLELLVLQTVQGDALLPWPKMKYFWQSNSLQLPWLPGVHGVLVDVILADVNVSLALEVSHHHLLHIAQVPHGVAVGVLRIRFKI